MASCVIFCAGGFSGLWEALEEKDYILAADGGYAHTQALGLVPHGILGDFDSLGYVPEGATVFPVEKDDTDAMLAVRHGLEQGFRRFVIYGGMDGPRLDHTVANLQTLCFLADHGAAGWLVGNTQVATVVKNGSLEFSAQARGGISVFCLGAPARGVTIRGLQYGLENGTLCPGFPLGVSNHFAGAPAQIRVEDGTLLVIFERGNQGLCK